MEQQRPLGYLGGGIMTHGENLARQEEYDKFKRAKIPGEVYSPVMNKSINFYKSILCCFICLLIVLVLFLVL